MLPNSTSSTWANDGGNGGRQDAVRTPGIQGTGESVTSALVGFKYGILFLEIPPLKLLAFSSLSGLSFPHARTLREREREREREFPVGWKRTRVLGRAALFEIHPCFFSTDNGLFFSLFFFYFFPLPLSLSLLPFGRRRIKRWKGLETFPFPRRFSIFNSFVQLFLPVSVSLSLSSSSSRFCSL